MAVGERGGGVRRARYRTAGRGAAAVIRGLRLAAGGRTIIRGAAELYPPVKVV